MIKFNNIKEVLEVIKKITYLNEIPILVVDEEEYILYCNKAFTKFICDEENEIIGSNLRKYTDRNQFSIFQINTVLRKNGISNIYKSSFIDKNSNIKNVYISASPIFLENKMLIFALIFDLDAIKKALDISFNF